MKNTFGIAAVLYLVLSAILFGYVRFYADNPDTFQYIVIAKKYSVADFQNAVNGYWSPLISWLLIIPNFIFADTILAFKILNLIIGLFVLYQWGLLIYSTGITNPLRKMLVFFSIPFLIDYALLNLTPDLLFIGMLLFTINIFLRGRAGNDNWVARKAGLAGGFLFLTKAFGLPLFIFLSAAILIYENRKFRINKKSVLYLYTSFAIVSLTWIIILSMHYGELTINRSVRFNNNLSLEMLYGDEFLPILGHGLIEPHSGQFSAWESPGDYLESITESPAGPRDRITRNIFSIYYSDFRRQVGIIFLLLFVAIIFLKRRELLNEKWKFILLVTIISVYAGYSLILVHTRYIWACTFLMLLLSTYYIQLLFKNNIARIIFCSCVFLFAIKKPVKEILFTRDIDMKAMQLFSSMMHPFSTMQNTYKEDAEINSFVKKAGDLSLNKDRLASVRRKNESRGGYATSLRLALAINAVYLGQEWNWNDRDLTNEEKESKNLQKDFQQKQIRYVLSFDFITQRDSLLLESQSGVKLYMLKY